jgi:hypothetical protein
MSPLTFFCYSSRRRAPHPAPQTDVVVPQSKIIAANKYTDTNVRAVPCVC